MEKLLQGLPMSLQPSITPQGIEEAINGLGYKSESALKYRLVAAIRERYGTGGEFTQPLQGIEAEELIRLLWSVDPDLDSLRSKKKNLSSIKSSVNSDLKRLYREGKNPEGITIGPENLFTISDEAKDDLLATIRSGGTAALLEIKKVAGILNGILTKDGLAGASQKEEMGADLQQIGHLLKSISEKMGVSGGPGSEGVRSEPEAPRLDSEEPRQEIKDLEPVEILELEGEIPEADLEEAVKELEVVEDECVVIDDSADLTEVSEGEVYETLEDIEEEDLEEIDDSEIPEEDMEFFGPETIDQAEGGLEGSSAMSGNGGEAEGAAGTGPGLEEAGSAGEMEEPLEAEDLEEVEVEEPAAECEDGEIVSVEAGLDEGDSAGNAMMEGADDLEGAPEEVVDALEVDEDLGELGEDEEPEDEDTEDVVFDAGIGEGTPLEGEGEGSGSGMENAPVQAISVGDEAGGTEPSEKGKTRMLAEKFNSSLSEMDRFYNQYLFIRSGVYTVGSAGAKEGRNSARRVRIEEFYVGKFPVTNALFDVFVEKTGYRTTAERVGYGVVYFGRLQRKVDPKTGREIVIWNSSMTSKIVQGAFWYQPSGPGSNLHHKRNHPVVQVSLEDAMAFAAWTGKRLPTEEEWEAASRTKKGCLYPWGNRSRKDACNLEGSGFGETTPVDRYIEFENDYGVVDTLGNVLEWTTGKAENHDEAGQKSVLYVAKGASWVTANAVNLTGHVEFVPEFHSNMLGFRCVAN